MAEGSNELELERLVVRLVGDKSSYSKIMAEAETEILHASKIMEDAARTATAAQNQALQEAAKITAAVATPTERYANEVHRLSGLLVSGYLSQETYNRAVEQLRSDLPEVAAHQALVNSRLEDARRVTQGVMSETERYDQTHAKLTGHLQRGEITQETYNRSLKELRATLPSVQAEQAQYDREIQHAQQVIDAVRPPLDRYNIQLARLDGLLQKNLISVGTHRRAIQQLQRDYEGIGKKLQNAGREITAVGRSMSLYVTAPIVGLGALSAREFGKFEQGLADMRAGANPTAAEMVKLEARSMELSKTLNTKPTGIVESMTELLKAGVPVEKVLGDDGVAAVQFAKVGQLAADVAAVTLADAMKVFGEEGTKTVNTLSSAADASSTNIEQITQAFSQVSAVAGQANQSLDDTAASIALLANYGIKGSDAGTSLKTMLLRLMAPVDRGAKVFDKYNLQVRNADGSMKSITGIVAELNKKFGDLDKQSKDEVLAALFGSDALRAGSIFLKAGVQGIEDMKTSMSGALSVSEKYATISGTQQGKWDAMVASLSRMAIKLGEVISGPLTSFFTWVTNIMEPIGQWIEANPKIATGLLAIAGTAAVIGPLLIVIGSTVTAVGTLTAACSTLAGATGLAGIVTASGLATGGLVALALGGIALVSKWIYDTDPGIVEYNKHLAEAHKLNDKILNRDQTQHEQTLKIATKYTDPSQKADFLGREVAKQKNELEGLQGTLKNAEEEVARYNGTWNQLTGNKNLERANVELAAVQARLDQGGKNYTELLSTYTAARNAAIKAQEELKNSTGGDEEATARASKATVRLQEKITALTTKLKGETELFKESSYAKQIYKLQQAGATEESLKEARALDSKLAGLKAAKKAEEEHKKEVEKATTIAAKYATPQEKLAKKQKELKGLLDKNLISLAAYNAEMKETIQDATKDATVNLKVVGVDAVEAGTAEALARVEEYRRGIDQARMVNSILYPDNAAAPKEMVAKTPTVGGPRFTAATATATSTGGRSDAKESTLMVEYLRQIAANTSKSPSKKPEVLIEPANLTGPG